MNTPNARLIIGTLLLLPACMNAQIAYTEGFINIPGGFAVNPTGIDANDQIVGHFQDSSFNDHGFVLSTGVIAQIDVPGTPGTRMNAINASKGIIGIAFTVGTNYQGFSDAGFRFKSISGSKEDYISGLNSAGEFAGTDRNGVGFININGVYIEVRPMFCDAASPSMHLYGPNANGDVVGSCVSQGNFVGFSRINGSDQIISVFGYAANPQGINDSGVIAGGFFDNNNQSHGFIISAGVPTQFDISNATQTQIQGISNKGSLVGVAIPAGNSAASGFYAFAN